MKALIEIRANIVSEHSHNKQKLDAFFESLRFPGFTYGIPGRTFQTEEELDQYIEEGTGTSSAGRPRLPQKTRLTNNRS